MKQQLKLLPLKDYMAIGIDNKHRFQELNVTPNTAADVLSKVGVSVDQDGESYVLSCNGSDPTPVSKNALAYVTLGVRIHHNQVWQPQQSQEGPTSKLQEVMARLEAKYATKAPGVDKHQSTPAALATYKGSTVVVTETNLDDGVSKIVDETGTLKVVMNEQLNVNMGQAVYAQGPKEETLEAQDNVVDISSTRKDKHPCTEPCAECDCANAEVKTKAITETLAINGRVVTAIGESQQDLYMMGVYLVNKAQLRIPYGQ